MSSFFDVAVDERVFINDFLKNDKIPKNGCQFASMRFFDETAMKCFQLRQRDEFSSKN